MTGAEFWDSADTHVAVAPGHDDGSVRDFVEAECGKHGWCLFQTSGSEGLPKWVALTKRALTISARAVNEHFGVTKADRWLLALPTWHVGGFGILARCFVGGNALRVFEGRWDAAAFAACCTREEATLASLVPTQVFDLVAAKIAAPESLRAVLVGGGAMSPDLALAARDLGWPLFPTYGMTETASQVASARPFGDGELEVLPIWQVSTDAEGVLTVRGEALASGYVVSQGEQWCWEPISASGGLQTRDRVSLLQDGSRQLLRFLGRESGIVKILGELVALGPIQQRIEDLRLQSEFQEGDAAICDVPDPRQGARLILATTGMSENRAESLLDELNRDLRPFEQIFRAISLPKLPRGALGKLRINDLRASLLASEATSGK